MKKELRYTFIKTDYMIPKQYKALDVHYHILFRQPYQNDSRYFCQHLIPTITTVVDKYFKVFFCAQNI